MISLLRRAFPILDRRARARFLVFAAGSVVIAVLEAVAVFLFVPLTQLLLASPDEPMPRAAELVDRFVSVSSNGQAAAVLGALVLCALTVKGVSAIVLLRWAIRNSVQQEARIARRLFAGYLAAPVSFHMKRNSAEIQRTLNESLVLVFRRTLPFVMGAAADAFTLVAIAVVIVLNDLGVAAVVTVYFLAVGFGYQRMFGGRQRLAAKRAHREASVRYRQVQESIRSAAELAVLHRQSYFVRRFFDTKLELVDAQSTIIFYQLLPRYFLDLAFVLGAALITVFTFATRGPTEELASVGLFLAASMRLIAPLNRMMTTIALARTAGPSIDQVVADLAQIESHRQLRTDVSTGPLHDCSIELSDIRFRYEDSEADVLDGVSLRIEARDDIGIVGSSGAGKTTLLNVLLGLLDPQSGDVLIGGKPVSQCRTDWQLSIGYVPQSIVLLDDTIRANIAFGIDAADVDEARLAEVLRIVQLETFIATLPLGLDTMAREQGLRLSGGQNQRLGLARALYHRPSVLVLDEATSALDSETEARIMGAIDALRGSMMIITVSHRLSTLKHCDRIYFLRAGRVDSVGTFDELIGREPEFARLVALAQLSA